MDFRTGLIIGVLATAVVALGVAVVVIAGDGDDEETTTVTATATGESTETAPPDAAAPVSCGRLPGPLGDNVFGVEASGVSCQEAFHTAQAWIDQKCGPGPPGVPCQLDSGFSCVYQQVGVESTEVDCTREEQTVSFQTGS